MSDGFEAAMAEVHGAHLRYEVRGRGEPLLLLHGMGGSGADWVHAGREALEKEYQLIIPDARGHGRSTNPGGGFRHAQLAMDALALLDHLGLPRCKAIGLSMGGNTLLHLATAVPDRIEAMVLVSATMSFPEQARAIMRQVVVEAPSPPTQRPSSPRRRSNSFADQACFSVRARSRSRYSWRGNSSTSTEPLDPSGV